MNTTSAIPLDLRASGNKSCPLAVPFGLSLSPIDVAAGPYAKQKFRRRIELFERVRYRHRDVPAKSATVRVLVQGEIEHAVKRLKFLESD